MKRDSNPSFNDKENEITKENIHNEYPKVTFNLLDNSQRKDFDIKTKKSLLSSNAKSKNFPSKEISFLNTNKNEIEQPKKMKMKLSKANLSIEGIPIAKSSLNINKNLMKTFITNTKISKTKSHFGSNNNHNNHRRSKLEQTKNNFLKLIKNSNKGNYVREYSNSKYSLLYNNNQVMEIYEGDDLDKVEQKLKSKIIDMGKEAEFKELEIGPLDISINRFNLKKKKKKISSKRTKYLDRKKYETSKKLIKTVIHKKKMMSQLSSSNSNNLNSENIVVNRSNQYMDDSKINLNEKKRISSNMNINSKIKDKGSYFASNFKKSNSNNINSKVNSKLISKANSKLNSKVNSKANSKENQKIKLYDKLASIFKSNSQKFEAPKNETLINRSKTYSNIDSKIGQTLVTNVE